jgi:hypothetical protein
MENYYTDLMRADLTLKDRIKMHFKGRVQSRRVIVVGSAPDPLFPAIEDACVVCVNGSAYSLARYTGREADISFLNAAIFRDNGAYTSATLTALSGRQIGDVLLNAPSSDSSIALMARHNIKHGAVYPISKYEKRLILTEVLGRKKLGFYRHAANVSNGVFMAAFSLWAGAKDVVLVGFSFLNNFHAYSPQSLSHRAHINEDALFLKLAAAQKLPISSTQTLELPREINDADV